MYGDFSYNVYENGRIMQFVSDEEYDEFHEKQKEEEERREHEEKERRERKKRRINIFLGIIMTL